MDYKEAINAIEKNYPPERYSMTFAIRTINNHYTPLEPQLHCVIVNGQPSHQTYMDYQDKGWIIMHTDRAKRFHPYAHETDTIIFMSKPIDKEAYDKYMSLDKLASLQESTDGNDTNG